MLNILYYKKIKKSTIFSLFFHYFSLNSVKFIKIYGVPLTFSPAAVDTLLAHFEDFNLSPGDYDLIVTGDLGKVGYSIVNDLMEKNGIKMKNYNDCGLMLYDLEKQDVHAGGSGCGCSGAVLCAHILPEIEKGKLKKVLFIGTGALMSPVSIQQGESIPGIAHAVVISKERV